jgi:hypothetical protein
VVTDRDTVGATGSTAKQRVTKGRLATWNVFPSVQAEFGSARVLRQAAQQTGYEFLSSAQ